MRIAMSLLLLALSATAIAAEPEWPSWEGWELMGTAGVFNYAPQESGARTLIVTSGGKGAALRKTATHELTRDLKLSWQWQLDQLPSVAAENTKATHHYFAVSAIFDNGKNLSYVWSATLPKGFSYACPLDDWIDKETHVVVDTGPVQPGRKVTYTRDLLADYARYVGGPPPKAVSKVWIVALGKDAPREIKASVLSLSLRDGKETRDYL